MSKQTFDSFVKRQITLERVKKGEGRKIIDSLYTPDKKTRAIINNLPRNPKEEDFQKAYQQIKELYKDHSLWFFSVGAVIASKIKKREEAWLKRKMEFDLDPATEPKIFTNKYKGRTIRSWTNRTYAKRIRLIKKALKPNLTIAERITELQKAFNVSNHDFQTVTNVLVTQTVARTRQEMLNNRIDLITWVSVLDSQTTDICMARSQKLYYANSLQPFGHSLPYGAGPGRIHFNCRSIAVPTEFNEDPTQYANDYEGWLRTQPLSTVEKILGKEQAKQFLIYGIALGAFVISRDSEIDIDNLP